MHTGVVRVSALDQGPCCPEMFRAVHNGCTVLQVLSSSPETPIPWWIKGTNTTDTYFARQDQPDHSAGAMDTDSSNTDYMFSQVWAELRSQISERNAKTFSSLGKIILFSTSYWEQLSFLNQELFCSSSLSGLSTSCPEMPPSFHIPGENNSQISCGCRNFLWLSSLMSAGLCLSAWKGMLKKDTVNLWKWGALQLILNETLGLELIAYFCCLFTHYFLFSLL